MQGTARCGWSTLFMAGWDRLKLVNVHSNTRGKHKIRLHAGYTDQPFRKVQSRLGPLETGLHHQQSMLNISFLSDQLEFFWLVFHGDTMTREHSYATRADKQT